MNFRTRHGDSLKIGQTGPWRFAEKDVSATCWMSASKFFELLLPTRSGHPDTNLLNTLKSTFFVHESLTRALTMSAIAWPMD
jgi:hypothetical protein